MRAGRKLQIWRLKEGISRNKLSKDIECRLKMKISPTSIQNWEEDSVEPRVTAAFAIEHITDGFVKAKDW